ncbi:hypothetical protein AAMO2058_001296900 [Amorphochlora amoebiformis]|uniref:Major facilitator superfamily (MFS) profile domain-containing protein n=1 Tax=Amorphochlora amoebiformis TaxID=1561963 RepID=A0A7S0DGD7_9EUKA|mmetsp:Transcript_27050/g.42933  ORF Transcript_27050/g.42933 Transcript_27050/m.42933 type:complete len:447 (+) Transcript_27050:139-1479(+)
MDSQECSEMSKGGGGSKEMCGCILKRHAIVLMCALCCLVCYCDRVIISVAVITMAKEFGWELTLQGQILGAFFYGYVLSQVIGAYLAKIYGGKLILNLAVAGWSLLTILTPVVAKISLPALIVCRIVLGFSEGMAFPVIYHVFSGWVPKHESSRSIVSLNFGVCSGTVLAFVVSPWLIERMGWEYVFYVFGYSGFAWCALWQMYGKDNDPPTTSKKGKDKSISFSRFLPLLRPSTLYCIYYCHFAWNMGLYITIMWLPTYLHERFNLDPDQTWINALPYLVMAPAAMCWSFLVDRFLARTSTLNTAVWIRKTATAIGFIGGAGALVLFGGCTNAHTAVLVLSLSLSLCSLSLSGWEAAKLHALDPSETGMLQGVSNTISNFSGVIGVPLASYVKKTTNSWHAVWIMCACIWFSAAIIYAFRIETPRKEEKQSDVERPLKPRRNASL